MSSYKVSESENHLSKTCEICNQRCLSDDALCTICRATITQLALIWSELPRLRSGAIFGRMDTVQTVAAVAVAKEAHQPRTPHLFSFFSSREIIKKLWALVRQKRAESFSSRPVASG